MLNKLFFSLLFVSCQALLHPVYAISNTYDLHLQVYPNEDQFQIIADYKVAMSPCQASAYLKDYEGARSIPGIKESKICLLYTSPSPRDRQKSRMPSSA